MDVTPISSTASKSHSLPESQITSTNPGNCSRSATDRALDYVHALLNELVKKILTGKFIKLSSIFPKNFNVLNLSQDEFLPLTVANLVIKVNNARTTSITDISEWTTTFSAYKSVLMSKLPHCVSTLLEYMLLDAIRS